MSIHWRHYLWKEIHPVPPGELDQLESDWGVQLPDDYKKLISLHQGMTPVPNSFNVGRSSNALSVLLTVTRDPTHEEYSIQHTYETFRPHLPPHIYPFGDTPGGEPVCFDYRGSPDQPRIVLVSTEASIHPVANSFTEFMAGLYND